MKYRSDIDGLRAIAVLSVIAFHYGLSKIGSLPLAQGGYVGVDIFFVISGYLITKIIYQEFNSGTYDIIKFYNRRIKRIFPCLMFIYLVCFIGGIFLFIPSEVENASKAILSSVFFVSNIFFSMQDSYFDAHLQSNPLLHTWSLSVEEQFYIIFPLLLLVIKGLSHSKKIILIGIGTILSLLLSEYMVHKNPTGAFYLVQSRSWELALGALLAIINPPPIGNWKWMKEFIGISGLFLIVGCIVFFVPSTPFPGLMAVLPCMGALAIIYSGLHGQTMVSKILSLPPIRFTGLISYSLYLWHWPVIVFYKTFSAPDKIESIVLIVVCYVLSTLSWKFIEQPFRNGVFGENHDRAIILKVAGFSMVIMSLLAFSMTSISNTYWNPDKKIQDISLYMDYQSEQSMLVGSCFLTSKYNDFTDYKKEQCLQIDPSKKNVLIFGDSHAAHLFPGFSKVYPDINFLYASASGCKPTLNPVGEKRCIDLVNFVLENFLPEHHLDAIVLSARWDRKDVISAVGSSETLTKYADNVYLVGPNAEYNMPLPRLIIRSILTNDPSLIDRHRESDQGVTDSLFQKQDLPARVHYISAYSVFCKNDCDVLIDNKIPVEFDTGHFTAAGAEVLAKAIREYPTFSMKGIGLN